MRTATRLGVAASLLALPLAAGAGDSPQWRGPDRDGVFKEAGLLGKWPKGGPPLAWTFKDAGTGFSSPAVVGGTVYTMGAKEGVEYLIALDDKGAEKWRAKVGPVFDFKINSWSRGPNATPAVDGGLVFALGSKGFLACVDTAGKPVWDLDLPKALNAQVNPVGGGPENFGWGFSWSPLVDGDQLVITPGGPDGLFAGLDKKSGRVLWRSKDVKEQATYASPVAATVSGVRMYVALTQDGAAGVGRDGALLWSYKRDNPFPDVVIPTPLVKDDLVFLTAWGGGDELLRLKSDGGKFAVEKVYSNKDLSNRVGGVVLVDGNVYGFHETQNWVCLDFRTGARKWDTRRNRRAVGAGSVAAAGDRLYVQAEDTGEVALLGASPEKYVEYGRFKLPEESQLRKVRGKVWTHPVIAGGRLYLRDQELVFCYKIK